MDVEKEKRHDPSHAEAKQALVDGFQQKKEEIPFLWSEWVVRADPRLNFGKMYKS